jgi:hypothetical protein
MRDMNDKRLDRAIGALVGLAVGDSIGTSLEFSERDSRPPVNDMIGGGPFRLRPGEWTDDTAMALCLADSLLACEGLNQRDLIERFCQWWHNGENSCTGDCFDVGITTREALRRFENTGDPIAGGTEPHKAGNGSLMRLAPVAIYWHRDRENVERAARAQSAGDSVNGFMRRPIARPQNLVFGLAFDRIEKHMSKQRARLDSGSGGVRRDEILSDQASRATHSVGIPLTP